LIIARYRKWSRLVCNITVICRATRVAAYLLESRRANDNAATQQVTANLKVTCQPIRCYHEIHSLNRNQWNFTDFSAILITISISEICTSYVFQYNTLILINESTPLLIKIAEKQWIFTNNHSHKYSTANQWIIHCFLFREHIYNFTKLT